MDFSSLVEIISKIKPYLPIVQIVIALLLMILVLIQPRGESLGSAFGQSFASVGKLRGASKTIFWFTIFLGTVFILLALINLIP
jgi:protein translocase SecG subunit